MHTLYLFPKDVLLVVTFDVREHTDKGLQDVLSADSELLAVPSSDPPKGDDKLFVVDESFGLSAGSGNLKTKTFWEKIITKK